MGPVSSRNRAAAREVRYLHGVIWGLLGAFGASACYGVASVLQALAARRTEAAAGLDPRLLLRLARSWRYLLGVGLDGLGWLLSLVAVLSLPLFVVQSIVASFLAVTAVLGAIVLHMPLNRTDKVALVVVLGGLVLVGLSATEDRSVDVSDVERWGVLVAAVALGVVAVPLARLAGPAGAVGLGAVAGLEYGATSVAARMLPETVTLEDLPGDLRLLLLEPAAYALVVAGAIAMLTYSTALQRGTVTQATGPLVVGETVAPAVVGVVLLGDQTRPGWEWAAVVGFTLAVAGAVGLARHGDVSADDRDVHPKEGASA